MKNASSESTGPAAKVAMRAPRAPRASRPQQPLPIPAQSCVGVVVAGGEAPEFRVLAGQVQARARCAASCLLVPQPGDTVACFWVAPDEIWILAVLEREPGAVQVLRSRGPTRIEIEGGGLELQAPAIALSAQQLGMDSERIEMSCDELEFTGQKVHIVASAVRSVGAMLSTVFDRVTHFAKHHARTTEGVDSVHATHLELQAQQLARISAEHALLNGDKLVKARGGQIHFG